LLAGVERVPVARVLSGFSAVVLSAASAVSVTFSALVPVPMPWKLKVVKSCALLFQSSRRKCEAANDAGVHAPARLRPALDCFRDG
jgi:hypothetical protein